MKHFYKALLIITLSPLFSFAQSNYKPGYVVTIKGDTLHGFIDYQEWDSNPTAVSFKSAVNDKNRQSFTVNDISFFDIAGFAAYKKYTCSVSMDETNTSRLGTSRDTSFQMETVFLKILQKGKNVALYQYTDGLKTRFYIGEAPDYTPTELVFRLYENVEANGTTVNENTYLKQLFALANKYNALDDDLTRTLQSANYSQPDLLPIVSKINGISKSEFSKKYAGRGKVNFYLSAALNISTTSANSSSPYITDGGVPYTSYLPALSLGVDVTPNPNTGRVELRAEISVGETRFNPLYKLKVEPYTEVEPTFNQLDVSIVPQIIYNFYNGENLKIYGGAGFDFTGFIFSNSFFGNQDSNLSNNGIGAANPYNFLRYSNSLLLTAGIKINKKLEIFGKYFSPMAITHEAYFQFNTTSQQVGVIYLFGK